RAPGDADDAPREVALEPVPRREERGVRAAVAERHAKALGVADGDVRAPLAGGREQGECEEVGCRGHERAARVRLLTQGAEVADATIGGRVLQQRAGPAAAEPARLGT